MYPLVAPDWFWSGEMIDDIGHSAVFDNTQDPHVRARLRPELTFHRAALRMVEWRHAHPELTQRDETTDAVLSRIVEAYHEAKGVFLARSPAATTVAS